MSTNEPPSIWNLEYSKFQSIPSSTRSLPSKALVLFDQIVNFKACAEVLDAGCGNGRNAVYLAGKGCRITAIDFSEEALIRTADLAKTAGLRDRIITHNLNLLEELPFAERTFDLILDSYVSCHFIQLDEFELFWNHTSRLLGEGGIAFTSMFDVDDEFYEARVIDHNQRGPVALDRSNKVMKQLVDESYFYNAFTRFGLAVEHSVKYRFYDVVLGRIYRRSILAAILRKNDADK